MNQSEKFGNEQANIARQKEHVENLKNQLRPYDGIDVAGEVRELLERDEQAANEANMLI